MKPQLTVNGEAIRLPMSDYILPLLDSLAVAYAAHPNAVGALLRLHGENVAAYDRAVVSPLATEYALAMRAAERDGSLEALLTEANAADDLDLHQTADEAVSLATRLMALVARIRRMTPKKAS